MHDQICYTNRPICRMIILKQSMKYYLKSADFCPYFTSLKKVSICVPIIIPGIL
jgi:hypothetical protein